MTNSRTRTAIRRHMAATGVNYTTAKRHLSDRSKTPPVGSRVKLDGGSHTNRWWTVLAADSRYAVAVRQANFQPKGTLIYTILDTHEHVRGPADTLGQGWAQLTTDGCQALLQALQNGTHAISHRNRAELSILAQEPTP